MSINCLATAPPDSGVAYLAAARSHLLAGRPDKAFLAADRVVAVYPELASAWFVIGESLAALGERAQAALAFERSLQLEPGQAVALARVGRVYDELDLPLLAEDRLLGAIAIDPADVESLVHLSALYGRAAQYELARDYAEKALAVVPNLADAHRNLAAILAKLGRDEEARSHRDLAYRGRSLLRETSPSPRRRVLILADAGWGNSPDRYLLPRDRYERWIWFIEYADEAMFGAVPDVDVVFNAIGDPDATGPSASNVARLLSGSDRTSLNRPEAVARSARHLAAELFAGLEDVDIPKTVRLDAETLSKLGPASSLAKSGLRAPLLLRPIGSHGGEGLLRISALDDETTIAPGRDYYATEFNDFRSPDGLYRKYRMFFVDRAPYPYHLAIAEHWLVHYQTSGTPDHLVRLAEERRFLEDPETALGPAAMNALRAIGKRLDLDFCGIDFSLTPDGRLLLFEANATMLVHPEAPDGPLAHKNEFVGRILQAFWTLVERADQH